MLAGAQLRALLSLVRWLGPWTGETRVPPGITCRTWVLRAGRPSGPAASGAPGWPPSQEPARLEARVYEPPGEPVGTYLLVHGLHFLGPTDPRLDRFCRVLAASGFRVVAPLLPAYLDLVLAPSVVEDLYTVARATQRELGVERMSIFSISFGSWPALEVAARLGAAATAVVTFGGYADLHATIRFALDGIVHTPQGPIATQSDPLNPPVVFLNMLPFLAQELGNEAAAALATAWRQMCYRTWGKPQLKTLAALTPIAHQVAEALPAAQRALFLTGCGIGEDGPALLERALTQGRERLAFADPAAALGRLASPVVVCHGRDDDVIPWTEAVKLHGAVAPRVQARLYLTGLYGHTGAGKPSPQAALQEGITLLKMAHSLARGGR